MTQSDEATHSIQSSGKSRYSTFGDIWGAIIGGAILSGIGWFVAASNWYSHTLVSAVVVNPYGPDTPAVYETHGSQFGMYAGLLVAGICEAAMFVGLIALAVAWGIRVAREEAAKPAAAPYVPKPNPWSSDGAQV